jgi:hypothetical protein
MYEQNIDLPVFLAPISNVVPPFSMYFSIGILSHGFVHC